MTVIFHHHKFHLQCCAFSCQASLQIFLPASVIGFILPNKLKKVVWRIHTKNHDFSEPIFPVFKLLGWDMKKQNKQTKNYIIYWKLELIWIVHLLALRCSSKLGNHQRNAGGLEDEPIFFSSWQLLIWDTIGSITLFLGRIFACKATNTTCGQRVM